MIYSTLFGIYGTTYGAGDGSTTFNLPDCRNRVLWGGETAGYISAGLPNITGGLESIDNEPLTFSDQLSWWGALYAGSIKTQSGGVDLKNGARYDGIYFNAEYANSIYGNSTTVQPPAIKCRVYTRYQ